MANSFIFILVFSLFLDIVLTLYISLFHHWRSPLFHINLSSVVLKLKTPFEEIAALQTGSNPIVKYTWQQFNDLILCTVQVVLIFSNHKQLPLRFSYVIYNNLPQSGTFHTCWARIIHHPQPAELLVVCKWE